MKQSQRAETDTLECWSVDYWRNLSQPGGRGGGRGRVCCETGWCQRSSAVDCEIKNWKGGMGPDHRALLDAELTYNQYMLILTHAHTHIFNDKKRK